MKQLQIFGFFVWILSAANALAASGVDAQRLAVLDATLDQYVQNGQLVGGVLYVSRHGEPVMHKAFGWQDREQSIAMNTRSLHRIASQTKAFTSVAIMLLQERGALLISDPLSKYFPEWAKTSVAVADSDADGGYRSELWMGYGTDGLAASKDCRLVFRGGSRIHARQGSAYGSLAPSRAAWAAICLWLQHGYSWCLSGASVGSKPRGLFTAAIICATADARYLLFCAS